MSSTEEDYVEPEHLPTASYEIIKEMREYPESSVESIKLSEDRVASGPPDPSIDIEKKGIDPNTKHYG